MCLGAGNKRDVQYPVVKFADTLEGNSRLTILFERIYVAMHWRGFLW